MLTTVMSKAALLEAARGFQEPTAIGFFGAFSERSQKARRSFERFCSSHPEFPAFLVDVSVVKDVHGQFGVSEVPTVILVHRGRVVQQVLGIESPEGYQAALLSAATESVKGPEAGTKAAPKVVVYSTQSCPWCVKAKNYLRSKGIAYRDVDVGRDQRAAQDLVLRSGQSGVPQIEIDGEIVVGFDQARIDRLLGLEGRAASA